MGIILNEFIEEAAEVRPSSRQFVWFELGQYVFIHFEVNTFTGREWGLGTEEVSLFNPEKLDCDQCAEAVKSTGLKGMILTAKHLDGLCLWPSEYTKYSIKNSQCKRHCKKSFRCMPKSWIKGWLLPFSMGSQCKMFWLGRV